MQHSWTILPRRVSFWKTVKMLQPAASSGSELKVTGEILLHWSSSLSWNWKSSMEDIRAAHFIEVGLAIWKYVLDFGQTDWAWSRRASARILKVVAWCQGREKPFMPKTITRVNLCILNNVQEVTAANIYASALRNEFQHKLEIAEQFMNEPRIFYPHQVDFRWEHENLLANICSHLILRTRIIDQCSGPLQIVRYLNLTQLLP